MPSYDFRCKNCGAEFDLFYKSYAAYDEATPTCPNCSSADLARVIRRVSVQAAPHDYARMSSNEMLNVMESGDSKQVDAMFKQVAGGAADPRAGVPFHEEAKKRTGKQSEKQPKKNSSPAD
ncbi:zinc ribbon domain-containing protein [Phototrophicus methaneseepsis]|uniref:Zinc ribbon domain-containing protein n=1 Tax=Phototrophicus methaneseepsis TaxID=2710758 RepID=A0A7S8EAT9_9CHLR|nr:zinc ribbon domain-containing protein [Phototrophicus methaneseepsis]QPC83541.1 zinc ribbon domain-containing protein [Phototrophicus methaneseepsis]